MVISYNWLKNYIDTGLTAPEIAVILTDIGLEVDDLRKAEAVRGGLDGVVVGHVTTCTKHPDADKLSLTTVDIGAEEELQIVCGAPNVAAGQKVLVATVGTTLYPAGQTEGFKIKKSKIRGVESHGMICAADELGLGNDHSGIVVLDDSAVAGTPAKEWLDLRDDYIIEIGLTPNRIDAASHYGVARDLCAYLRSRGENIKACLPPVDAFAIDNLDLPITVEVTDSEAVPRYAGLTMTGLRVGPSPEWLAERLRAIGINPKNNIVDATNFVLHETGQPLHAFDARITGERIIVGNCAEGTKFTTLDLTERELSEGDITINNQAGPMCIAGVLGGTRSGVSDDTTSVFIESAYFDPSRVRRTARRHGINTDSSFRFERGADPNMVIYALKRAALLIKEIAGGTISSDITDIYPVKIEPYRFGFSLEYLNSLAGQEIPEATVRDILSALEITVTSENEGTLEVSVPPYRVDVTRPADLAEDILRIYGYNNIEIPTRISASIPTAVRPDRNSIRNIAADLLSSCGYTEIMSNSLTKESYYEKLKDFPIGKSVRIINPLSSDLGLMRQTLLFNALEAIQLNVNRRRENLKLYELGNRYFYDADKKGEGNVLTPYKEISTLSIAVTGAVENPSWNIRPAKSDFFTLRSSVERLLGRFGIDLYQMESGTPTGSDVYSDSITYSRSGKELLRMGSVESGILKKFDLDNSVWFAEIDFDMLVRLAAKNTITVQDLSRFPEVRRDLALLIDKSVTFESLRKVALSAERKLLRSVHLFDVYEGDKLPEGKKSYAISLILEDKTRTLTDQLIERAVNNIVSRLGQECGAELRTQ